MHRYIYRIYSQGKYKGTFDITTHADSRAAQVIAQRHANQLYPTAATQEQRA